MQDPSHGPYRDDLAGALARIEHLENENRHLRDQLHDQLHDQAGGDAERRDSHAPSSLRPARAALLLPLVTSWGLLMTAALVRFAAHGVGPGDADPCDVRASSGSSLNVHSYVQPYQGRRATTPDELRRRVYESTESVPVRVF